MSDPTITVPDPQSAKKKKPWSQSVGDYGDRIRVYETDSGIIYYDISSRGIMGRSLRHRDRKRAVQWAKEQNAKMVTGDDIALGSTARLKKVFDLYLDRQTPTKSESQQDADRQRVALWTRVLGPTKDLSRLTKDEWMDFTRDRGGGAIDARGKPVPVDQRTPVRPGTVAADLQFLRAVLRWACDDRGLMRSDPSAKFKLPKDINVRREIASDDRFQAIRAVSDQILMEVGRGKTARKERSYLSELLTIVNGTARRISAVCQLRHEDLRLDKTTSRPFGAIRWPEETDKEGREWTTPINAEVRDALDRIRRERPGIAGYLFPAPRNPEKPIHKDLASGWLEQAEKLANLPKQEGTLWHAYRRKWVTERKHLPDADVEKAGGWAKGSTAMKLCYEQADDSTVLEVVTQPRKLREVKQA
jgi:integrase